MSKMPPRHVLRSIVEDAISDREGLCDETIKDETRASIVSYRDLLGTLAKERQALTEADREVLKQACLHARIWRESYLESWLNTGDKQVIHEAGQDVDRITRTEAALGGRYMTALDHALANSVPVSIFDLRKGDAYSQPIIGNSSDN